MKLSMHLKLLIGVIVLVALTSLWATLSGCSRGLTLHPITDQDIYIKDNGDICMSEMYFKEVLDARLEME